MNGQINIPEALESLETEGYMSLEMLAGNFLEDLRSVANDESSEKIYERKQGFEEFIRGNQQMDAFLDGVQSSFASSHRYDFTKSYTILRTVRKDSEVKEAYLTHYDSYFLTFVFPLHVPVGCGGELYLLPNKRKHPTGFLSDFMGKVESRTLRGKSQIDGIKEPARVQFNFQDQKPVVFLGDRCMHGNLPMSFKNSSESFRQTLLFHVGKPRFLTIGKLNEIIRRR